MTRGLVIAGGLSGAAGVALSAYAAHAGGSNAATAATFLLAHGPLFVAIGLLAPTGLTRLAGWTVFAGVVLFAGDLLARQFVGHRLFPVAAPAGGVLMILGWLVVAVSGVVGTRGAPSGER